MKEHEKLLAFIVLLVAVVLLALICIVWPITSDGTQRVVDAVVGGLMLALGVAANALFRIRDEQDKLVTVDNPPSQPIPVEPQQNAEGLPDYVR